jgi:hypothetical protein
MVVLCPHPVSAVFGLFEPPSRLDVICRLCWTAFDVDSMPMDLLERLVSHICAGNFVGVPHA